MKKFFVFIFIFIFSINSFGQVIGQKNGKVYTVRFYKEYSDTLSMEQVELDFRTAVNETLINKCNKLSIIDNEGMPWLLVTCKNNEDIENQVNQFRKIVEDMWSSGFGKGEKIVQTVECGPKYRSETYLNGTLVSSFETDWDAGYFSTECSTYQSGGDIFVTKTFYVPAGTYRKEITKSSVKFIEGVVNYANKVYYIN